VPPPAPNAAVRRFVAVQAASLALKLAALALFVALVAKYVGGW